MLKQNLKFASSALGLFLSLNAFSQRVEIMEMIPADEIKASASSYIRSATPQSAVNGDGMIDEGHVSNNTGELMWISKVSEKPVRFAKGTPSGVVWFATEFCSPRRVDRICIWNHNQNNHTRRGLRKVYVDYSEDGEHWTRLERGGSSFHMIPESVGKNGERADYTLDTPGLRFRYLCITADMKEGNYYDMSDPAIAQETADMHQNPAYYGLAEIRFYTSQTRKASDLPKPEGMQLAASQGYLKTADGPAREFTLSFSQPLYTSGVLSFDTGKDRWSVKLAAEPGGRREYEGLFPAGYMEEGCRLKVSLASAQGSCDRTFDVPAARKWEVHFFSHSHQDIGYTHRQSDVMKLQWRNLERAIALAERTRDYPEGSRYCWNSEATWSVMGYLEEYAGTEKAERLIKAIRDTTISVDALEGSIITGISRQEELMHICDDAHIIAKLTGVDCTTAMMSDVPGQVWGLVPAMAKNGVRYYSPAPNFVPFYGRIGNDRAAALHIKWGDRPFWWQSQSGEDKVLVWEAGKGYSWFHGWLAGRLSVCGLPPIWEYLEQLENEEFPYDMCYLRYTVHGDNGPADEQMPDIIRAWNEKYDSPHFSISTAKKFFSDFERRFGDTLPVYGGDMTPTWEDGAASTAAETAMNRRSAASLAQSSIISAMTGSSYDAASYYRGYKNVLLFSEHTWGSSDSGPNPDSQFTRDLWAGKKMYADSAAFWADGARKAAVSPLEDAAGQYIHVLNTNLWKRTDVVYLDGYQELAALEDASGEMVPVQRLADGRYAFIAADVPAMGSAVYRICRKARVAEYQPMAVADNVLDNGMARVEIDRQSGNIVSFTKAGDPFEYVSEGGLNEYLYTERVAKNPRGVSSVTGIEILDNGPVLATVRIVSDAPGCNVLYRDVTIFRGMDKVAILNTLDKQDIREHESVRFIFPFNFPHPDISMDLAMSEVHPEREQLSGVNKHYYSVQNGLSVGDLEHVVCLTTVDAPFIELGTPSGEDYKKNPRHGYGWWPAAQISPKVYSWVMTNTWRTNYKASQGGIARFEYTLQACDPVYPALKRRGLEQEQKLVAVRSGRKEPLAAPFTLKGHHELSVSAMSASEDGRTVTVSLQNLWNQPVRTGFSWNGLRGREAWKCDFAGNNVGKMDPEDFWLKPYEYVMIKISVE